MDDEPVLMLSPINAEPFVQGIFGRALNVAGLFLSVFWLAVCGFFIADRYGMQQLGIMAPHELGAMLAGIMAPVALLWMIVSTIRRVASR